MRTVELVTVNARMTTRRLGCAPLVNCGLIFQSRLKMCFLHKDPTEPYNPHASQRKKRRTNTLALLPVAIGIKVESIMQHDHYE